MLLRVPAPPPFCSSEQKTFRENAFCIASDKDKDKGPTFDGNCSLPLCWTSSADIEMPRKKGFRMRRTPKATQAVDCAVATKGREEVSSLSPVEVPTGGLQKVVKGSFHQGNTRFKYAGTQCMAIAFCATALHSIKNVLLWDTADLDMAVVEGDQLYTTLRERHVICHQSHFLCATELPKQEVIAGHKFEFCVKDDYALGDVNVVSSYYIENGIHVTLHDALHTMFGKYSTCILTVCQSSCAIICDAGQYCLVDSHSRSCNGMVCSDGTSVVLCFGGLGALANHISNLAAGFGGAEKLFEIAGVVVTVVADRKRHLEMMTGDDGKKFKMADISSTCASDVEVISVVTTQHAFCPMLQNDSKDVCQLLNIDCEVKTVPVNLRVGPLGAPCKKESIVADGNCFFRAISQAVSGTQKNHRKIRLHVVKHMENHCEDYEKLLRSEYNCLTEYISVSKMKYVNSWATEVEIQAAADSLGINIFTFYGGHWLRYSSTSESSRGIYLDNSSGNHYECVTCVNEGQLGSCFGICQNGTSQVSQYGTRSHRHQVICADSEVAVGLSDVVETGKEKHQSMVPLVSPSKYIQKKKALAQRSKYVAEMLEREKKITMSVKKYKEEVVFRQRMKSRSVAKYRSDVVHQNIVKTSSITKYRSDSLHRDRVKAQSVKKYKVDTRHRAIVKLASIQKYHSNLEHKMRVMADVKARRHAAKLREEEFDVVVENFLEKVKNGPQFVCCVCHRLMFKHQVLQCHREHYSKSASASLVNTCINEDYLHKCSAECTVPCLLLESGRGQLWVCYTCHYKVSKGEFPPECVANNLGVDPIPPELACLNSLEQHLIALNIPFMKMLALPKGGQNGVHGPVTCVPANVVETTNLLPRSNMEGSMLRVKLKRKLTYKGHYEYHFVDSMHIREALRYLKESNVHYEDIEYNEEWVNDFCREPDASQVEDSVPAVDVTPPLDAEDELLHDRQQHCMFQDTCLMPVDIGQEVLDQYYDNILNVAPAEGNNPVRLLSDHSNEAKCFPVLFPHGRFTFHDTRQYRLTASRYFNNRVMHADKRFGQNVEYIFYAQYLCELLQVVSSISIALRKGIAGLVAKMAKDLLTNDESLKTLLECDQGYRFLKPIRGTPAFWQSTQRDILACVRQLGVPTWFCSFSSADLRWQNLVDCVLRQEGRTQTAAELEWADRCDLLRRNPVTAARMFDFRWHVFLRGVIMSSSQPIGKVVDYFYRVEFQQRGSPHVHCLFWVENAPRIDVNSDEEVANFIDRYVTCELQTQDEGLTETTVSSVQQHSKRHSKTCKKKNTVCRFGFPKPVSGRTFISHQFDGQGQKTCTCQDSQSTGVKHAHVQKHPKMPQT
uniref:uncharacterized protein LOC131101719 n=1 Tax=Doryrhamphus excisus TaxID=161450 RepID=UPI0025AEA00A|nr:uncharacterized protein LOC131101719 [Doryrhamphus excisus]